MTTNIWLDGSCAPTNPGQGGCAWLIILEGGAIRRGQVGYRLTTNNRMEIMAAIHAVRYCREDSVVFHTDSQYLSNAFNKGWLAKWLQRGGIRADGHAVLNWDLWMALWEMMNNRLNTWEWVWVRGHSGSPANEDCDRRARGAAERPTKEDKGYAKSQGS